MTFKISRFQSVDEEIEEYPFGYFLATLNGNAWNSYRDRETHDSNFSLSPIRHHADIVGPDSLAWIGVGHMVATATGVSNLLSWCRHCIAKGLQKAGDAVLPHRWYHQELQKTLKRLDVLEKELQAIKNKSLNEVPVPKTSTVTCVCCPNCGKNNNTTGPFDSSLSTFPLQTVPPPPPPPPPPLPTKVPSYSKPKKKRKVPQEVGADCQQLQITANDLQKIKLRKVEAQKTTLSNNEIPVISDKDLKGVVLKKSQANRTGKENIQDRIASEVLSFKGCLKKTAVKRSPGGTPIVSRKRRQQTGQGLTPMMAQALQHKFMNARNSPPSGDNSLELSPPSVHSSQDRLNEPPKTETAL